MRVIDEPVWEVLTLTLDKKADFHQSILAAQLLMQYYFFTMGSGYGHGSG